jgi:hypothetical protein
MLDWIAPRGIFHQLILGYSCKNKKNTLLILNNLNNRFFKLDGRMLLKLQILLMKILIFYPSLGRFVLSVYYKHVKGVTSGVHNLRNRNHV